MSYEGVLSHRSLSSCGSDGKTTEGETSRIKMRVRLVVSKEVEGIIGRTRYTLHIENSTIADIKMTEKSSQIVANYSDEIL